MSPLSSALSSSKRLVVAGSAALLALAACVGSDPTLDTAAPGGSSGSSGASGSSGPSGSSGSAGSSGASGGSDGGGQADGAPDAAPDAATLPVVACSEDPIVSGAFNFRCSAAAGTITPGGTIVVGTYLLTRWWDNTACAGGVFHIGWGTVFQQDGKSFLRYVRIQKAAAGDVGTKHVGTLWLDAGGAGALDRTEVCDAVTKGTKTTGHYEQTAGAGTTLTLDLADHQEKWTKQ